MTAQIPYLDEYRQLFDGAHRKAAMPLGAPAITMHLAFWKPLALADVMEDPPPLTAKHFTDSPKSHSEQQRIRREREIDLFLVEVYERLRFTRTDICKKFQSDSEIKFGLKISETWLTLFRNIYDVTKRLRQLDRKAHGLQSSAIDPLADLDLVPDDTIKERQFERSSQHQTINYNFEWRGIPARLRFELSTEYFTVTAFLDFEKCSAFEESLTTDTKAPRAKAQAAFANLFRTITDELEARRRAKTDPAAYTPDEFRAAHCADGAHRVLYHDLWDQFRSEVLITPGVPQADPTKPAKFGRLFGDFRGLVLRVGPTDQATEPAFQMPVAKPSTEEKWREKKAPTSWSDDVVRRFWTFLSCGDRVPLKKFEFTASKMIRGRAVYISALGAQPVEPLGAREPVLFFIGVWMRKKWQLGRLLDSLHQLGTLRLAAIIELDRLHKSGGWLRDIEKLIDATRQFIQSKSANTSGGKLSTAQTTRKEAIRQEANRKTATEEIVKEVGFNLAMMEGGLAKIYKIGYDRNLGNQSLAYRLERAGYYVQQFVAGVRRIQPERIEGFQPYDQFVFRRLGSAFAYVQMLNERLQRIIRDIRFYVEYLAAESAVLQAIESNQTNSAIKNAQTVAEIALFAALLPYYLGHILVAVVAGGPIFSGLSLLMPNDAVLIEVVRSTIEWCIWIILFAVGLYVAMRRWMENPDIAPDWQKRIDRFIEAAKRRYKAVAEWLNKDIFSKPS